MCVLCKNSVLIMVTPVALLGTAFCPRAIRSHQLAKVEGGMEQWGNKWLAALIGCPWLPVLSQSKTSCIFSCSEAYVITSLSVITLTLPSLRPGWAGWSFSSFHYSYLSLQGALHPNKQLPPNRTTKPFYFCNKTKVCPLMQIGTNTGAGGVGSVL